MAENNRIVINLDPPKIAPNAAGKTSASAPKFSSNSEPEIRPKKRGRLGRILLILGALLILVLLGVGIAGYFWWSNLQRSPSYSLALLIAAAHKDDKAGIDKMLDTNAVVDKFIPQITEKATEKYGRGFPPAVIARAKQLIPQVTPIIAERARAEIPRLIKEKAQAAKDYSPWLMAIGISRVVTVKENGDDATVTATLNERPVELIMRRDGANWKVIGVKDEALADKITEEIAQKILQIANQKQTGKNPNNQKLIEQITKELQIIKP